MNLQLTTSDQPALWRQYSNLRERGNRLFEQHIAALRAGHKSLAAKIHDEWELVDCLAEHSFQQWKQAARAERKF